MIPRARASLLTDGWTQELMSCVVVVVIVTNSIRFFRLFVVRISPRVDLYKVMMLILYI